MAKNKDNIESIRHSLAHLMAMAITSKHPEVKLGIGPTIENGFYYDFDFSAPDHSPTEEKFAEIGKFYPRTYKTRYQVCQRRNFHRKSPRNFQKPAI